MKKSSPWIERFPEIAAPTHQSLSEHVYELLFQAILRGKIGPNEHLAEQPIADSLGVSRISVREAIRHLAKDGLIKIFPNRGAFTLDFTPEDIEEIFSLRAVLESLGIRLATERANRTDLARLEDIIDEMDEIEKSDDRLAGAWADAKFHSTLMEISRHERALHAWRSMSAQITMAVYNSTTYYPDIQGLAERHQGIVEIIRAGEPDAAATCITNHILEGGRLLLQAVGRDQVIEREKHHLHTKQINKGEA